MLNYFFTTEGFMIAGLSLMLVLTKEDKKNYRQSYFVYLVTLLSCCLLILTSQTNFASFFESPLSQGYESQFIEVLGFIFSVITGYFFVRDDFEHKQEGLMLLLIATLGFVTLIKSEHMLTIYMGMELISFPLYTLVALSGQKFSQEAALKYFIQGSLASALFLFGVSILYGIYGYDALVLSNHSLLQENTLIFAKESFFLLESFGLILMTATIIFKLGLAPFHFWVSDVYSRSQPSFVMFLGILPKIAFFTIGFKIIPLWFVTDLHFSFDNILVFTVVTTALWANTSALVAVNLGRVLGYSAIAQMSFLFLVYLIGVENPYSYHLGIFHLTVYGFTTSIIFGAFVLSKQNLSVSETNLRGLLVKEPLMAKMVIFSLFSLAGIPPLPGFLTKFLILKSVVSAGYSVLALFMLITSIVACAYYIRLISYIVEPGQPDDQTGARSVNCKGYSYHIIGFLFVLLLCVSANPTVFLR